MDRTVAAIVAVALALLALMGVVYGSSAGFFAAKAANMDAYVAETVVSARSAFSVGPNGYTNFTTANIQTLIDQKIVAKGLLLAGVLTDPWGNTMALASANNASQGTITFGGAKMGANDCAKTVVGLSDYISLKVGTTTFTETSMPDPVSAKTACATGTTIVLTFQ